MRTWQAVVRTEDTNSLLRDANGASALAGIKAPFASTLTPLLAHLTFAWKWVERKRTQQIASRRLRVAETISLGEKRFVSILQVDGAQFLIGGSAGNVSLLAILDKQQAIPATEQL